MNKKTKEGSISYTSGECITETIRTSDAKLTQGSHQAKLAVTGILDFGMPDIKISAFPNPTMEFIRLKLESNNAHNMCYQQAILKGRKDS